VKIDVNQIPVEGFTIEEDLSPKDLDLETEQIRFSSPLRVSAEVSRITNAVSVKLQVSAKLHFSCSRCLEDSETVFDKKFGLNYPVVKSDRFIDLNPEIREEIIIDYPIKPLCKASCKGLCLKCGKNLNQGGCTCGST
jgi:uncharacterized protein